MPPRDTDPDRDNARRSADAPRDSARPGTERRHGGSAFAREPRGSGPSHPGSSYGAPSGGRASGSQAYGSQPSTDEGHPTHSSDGDSADVSPPVYGQKQARREDIGGWAGPERRADAPAARRQRSWPASPAPREPASAGVQRPDDTQFDADYRQWRDEQMRLLDLDYAQWRKERYRKFAEEFSQWRSQRLQSPRKAAVGEEPGASLGDLSPLGTPTPAAEERDRPPSPERDRPSGGLLGSLLGSHPDRHKPRP